MKPAGASGAVLLFVLVLVALLSTLAIQTVRTSQLEVFASYAGVYANQAEAMVESGLMASAALLSADAAEDISDNLTEDWAYFPDLTSYPGRWFLNGHVQGHIQDETGKFPINSLHPDLGDHEIFNGIFLRLLMGKPFLLPKGQAEALLAALVDWIDPDDAPSPAGAEDASYAAAQLPYRPKNNSIDTLSELLLIKGFSRELLFGHGQTPGLFDMLTVWGPGLININTAPLPVLAALPVNIDASQAQAVAEAADVYRRDPVRRANLVSLDWLQQAVPNQSVEWPTAALAVKSRFFSVNLEGRSGAASKRLFAVLKRERAQGGRMHCLVLYRELR
jgi:general secretion pathway protein K